MSCKAEQMSDQMVCVCGNSWDIGDIFLPECRATPTLDNDRPTSGTTGARNAFETQAGVAGMKATQFLSDAAAVQQERGQQYDSPEGERSGGKIAAAFNAITGKDLCAAEVYLILQITKDVRQWTASEYHHDSALDCVSYAALKAEALSGGG